ncbi:MAG TPA: alpha/beta fold hydrolase [Pseudomonadota bacterium]|nr:alpha/beta fold hydrolase [Pseudomonadota bacterium]
MNQPLVHLAASSSSSSSSLSTGSAAAARRALQRVLLLCGVALGLHCGSVPPGSPGGAQIADCIDETCLSQSRSALSSPAAAGPYRPLRFDLTVPLGGGGSLAVTVAGPTDDGRELTKALGALPLVVLSPGFVIARTQYNGYLTRLASHGFIVVSQTARAEAKHAQYRDDTSKLIDWLIAPTGSSASRLSGRIDSRRIGLTGHSLGGKISLLTAAVDPRVKAVITIDPVDGGAPLAKDSIGAIRLPAGVPLGFLGETISKTGGAQPCAPADSNYEVLYRSSSASRFALRFLKAAHTDFVDNPAGCFPCLFCPGSLAPKAESRDLAIKYVTAYFLWTLAGDRSAESFLTGTEVQKDVMAGNVELTKS